MRRRGSVPPQPDALPGVALAGPTWDRLEDQIRWYDAKSMNAQRWYKRTKFVELVAAASLPVIATSQKTSLLISLLGTAIVILEGLQHLSQHHEHWITYRSTCESLKHERYLYLAGAGPYASENAHLILAERTEGLISHEHAKWVANVERSTSQGRGRDDPGHALRMSASPEVPL